MTLACILTHFKSRLVHWILTYVCINVLGESWKYQPSSPVCVWLKSGLQNYRLYNCFCRSESILRYRNCHNSVEQYEECNFKWFIRKEECQFLNVSDTSNTFIIRTVWKSLFHSRHLIWIQIRTFPFFIDNFFH